MAVHYVRVLGSTFHKKITKYTSKSRKSAKISFKMMKINEHFMEIASKNALIALKHPENEVFPPRVQNPLKIKKISRKSVGIPLKVLKF